MEKNRLTIPYIIRNWKSLKVKQKRTVLTVLLIGAALLLFIIALIIGIISCSGKAEPPEASNVEPLPALLRAPDSIAVTGEGTNANPGGEDTDPDLSGLVLLEEPDDDDETGEQPAQSGDAAAYATLRRRQRVVLAQEDAAVAAPVRPPARMQADIEVLAVVVVTRLLPS